MKRVLLGALLAVGACGSEDPAPTCQQAMAHFYGVNCFYADATVSPPRKLPQAEMIALCQDLALNAPDSCQGEIDDWLVCNNAVIGSPAGETPQLGDPRCDCSQEQMALLRCD
jgi:hypothetical protein